MKIMQEQRQKGQEVYGQLIRKASQSHVFKKNLIENPHQTIENEIGNGFRFSTNRNNIIVEDQSDEKIIYLNIPRKINLDELELTDEELEKVAGGNGAPVTTPTTVIVVAYTLFQIGREIFRETHTCEE